ncbi:hypothetical protein [Paenibacillus humicola]|uniref:hypothetical protein n=1 Tax=Paenibacillus humicola TaxID=3110540 RepID=UPI00237ACA80|nr:hypothetical protein [Paenibacillus humicola]
MINRFRVKAAARGFTINRFRVKAACRRLVINPFPQQQIQSKSCIPAFLIHFFMALQLLDLNLKTGYFFFHPFHSFEAAHNNYDYQDQKKQSLKAAKWQFPIPS